MPTSRPSGLAKTILLAFIILGGAAVLWFLSWSVTNSINRTLDPLRQTNNELATQVANLLHPTSTIIPDPVTIIDEVRLLARLETIQYTVEQVIRAESGQEILGWLFGKKMLFVAHGKVIAGVDLQKITPADLLLEEGILYVTLPSAEIFTVALDEQASYVYDYDRGILSPEDPNLETSVRQAAEEKIRQAAIEDGILALAQANAETFLARFFQMLGYPQVTFVQPTP